MKKLLAYQISGQTVGIEIHTWDEEMLSENKAFIAIESSGNIPTGYVDISSIINWNNYGRVCNLSFDDIRTEINQIKPPIKEEVTEEEAKILKDFEISYTNSIIMAYYGDNGIMTGLDLEPHIDRVDNSEFSPNTTKTVNVIGVNFAPFSTVEVSGVGNFVNTVFYVSPVQLNVEITVGTEEGLFNIVVNNNELHSKDSGYEQISVMSKTIVDLRTYDIQLLGIEMTASINVAQDATRGLRFTSTTSSWNRGVKIGAFTWNREEDKTYEVIFTITADVLFMVGIAAADLNVASINSAYYKQDIGAYINNNILNTIYGGGDVTNWSQGTGTNIVLAKNIFYKLKFDFSGLQGYNCSISEVNVNNWDEEKILHSWVSNCPANSPILTPFILPQASSGAYYITGFRY